MTNQFASRDISWLSFNGRVLEEAADATVPLMERLRFRFLQVIFPGKKNNSFFSKSNQLYLAVNIQLRKSITEIILISIPPDTISRFYTITENAVKYIFFLELKKAPRNWARY